MDENVQERRGPNLTPRKGPGSQTKVQRKGHPRKESLCAWCVTVLPHWEGSRNNFYGEGAEASQL